VDACSAATDSVSDLAGREPVVVRCDLDDPSTDAGALDVLDGRQHGVFLGVSLTVEEAEHRTVGFGREGPVVAASLVQSV